MSNLIIIGARGFGREIFNLAMDCISAGANFTVKGYLDDKHDALSDYPNYPPILSSVENYSIQPDDVFVCALGDVQYKRLYAEKILNKGGRFISLIHPSINQWQNTIWGEGCIAMRNVVVSCDVSIGNFVTLMDNCVIGHDAHIGDWSHVGAGSFMGGFSSIGSMTTLHPPVELLPHKSVADNATVGAGSVVLRNVKGGVTVFGIPATKL